MSPQPPSSIAMQATATEPTQTRFITGQYYTVYVNMYNPETNGYEYISYSARFNRMEIDTGVWNRPRYYEFYRPDTDITVRFCDQDFIESDYFVEICHD